MEDGRWQRRKDGRRRADSSLATSAVSCVSWFCFRFQLSLPTVWFTVFSIIAHVPPKHTNSRRSLAGTPPPIHRNVNRVGHALISFAYLLREV